MDVQKRPLSSLSIETLKAPTLALGVFLLLAGFGAWLVNGFDTPTRILLAVGILLVGVYVAIDPEDIWQRLRSPTAARGGNTLVLAAAVIGILALVNVVANNRQQRWDLTANQQYSLSDQTITVIQALPQPVQVTAFYEEGSRQDARDLLKEYEVRSGGTISVEYVDPVAQPGRAQAAGIRELGTVVLQMGDQRQSVTGSRESDFTTAFLRLTNPTQKKVYFTVGHQERQIDGFERDSFGQIKQSLEGDNYLVEPLLLAGTNEVPADASVVVVAEPRTAFGAEELQAIRAYLDRGGKLLLLTQPSLGPNVQQVPLSDLVSQYGVEIGSLPVVEGNPQNVLARDPLIPVVAQFPSQKITEGLGLVFFPTTTYINAPQNQTSDAVISPLIRTTDRSWAESNLQQIQFDEGTDTRGPLTLALAIEASATNAQADPQNPDAAPKTRVVIFGDADFVSNEILNLPVPSSNRDLFVNAVNWLAEEEQLISIRPKERDNRNIFLTAAQQNLVLFSSTLFLPAIVLAIGGFIWWSRR